MQALAREHTAAAIQTLVECLRDPRLRVQAATALLDRAWGKPIQPVSGGDGNSPAVQHLIAAQIISGELIRELASRPQRPPLRSRPRSSTSRSSRPRRNSWPGTATVSRSTAVNA